MHPIIRVFKCIFYFYAYIYISKHVYNRRRKPGNKFLKAPLSCSRETYISILRRRSWPEVIWRLVVVCLWWWAALLNPRTLQKISRDGRCLVVCSFVPWLLRNLGPRIIVRRVGAGTLIRARRRLEEVREDMTKGTNEEQEKKIGKEKGNDGGTDWRNKTKETMEGRIEGTKRRKGWRNGLKEQDEGKDGGTNWRNRTKEGWRNGLNNRKDGKNGGTDWRNKTNETMEGRIEGTGRRKEWRNGLKE